MQGGKRAGAGRKFRYDSPTKVMRVPESMVEDIRAYIDNGNAMELPFYACSVSAGFPSPADDHVERKLDLNEHIIQHPSATFFVSASGDSMINAGIHDGDLLVVDRSIEAVHSKIVIAAVYGDLTVKRYIKKGNKAYLAPENDKYTPIEIKEGDDVHVWGVVTNVVHKV